MDRIEELKKWIEEVEKRISILPKQMKWLEVDVPLMVKDPSDPKGLRKIRHPSERVTQRRMDIIDANDPFKYPFLHFHTYPDHPVYNKDWWKHGDVIISMRPDAERLIEEIKFLIQQLEEKQNATNH